jgi:hypothetical protein
MLGLAFLLSALVGTGLAQNLTVPNTWRVCLPNTLITRARSNARRAENCSDAIPRTTGKPR